MAGYNFIRPNRDQLFLMPPALQDWLPSDDLAYFLLDAVDQFDLTPFYAAYRADGVGQAAFQPHMMVALLLYAYCLGVRSSRQIERLCQRDVAFRVVAGNLRPDHATIARFRQRHSEALKGLFTDILRLCKEAGLVKVGVVALDGTKMAADAALDANRTYESIRSGSRDDAGRRPRRRMSRRIGSTARSGAGTSCPRRCGTAAVGSSG